MRQNRTRMWYDRQLQNTYATCCKRALDQSFFPVAFLVATALACAGCQTVLPPLPNPPGPKTAVRLSPGDTIKVTFAEESDLDQTQKIRRDGKISLPLIGEVTAAGKRLMDLQREIVSLYEGRLDNPEVLLILESGTATAIVAGFANHPGKVDFDRPKTVYQAIMDAGGVSDYGSLRNIHLTRVINGVQRTETINLRPTVHGEPTAPEYVQDGDVIYISRSWF
jgi:polysaccharide export outer membrane protein